MLSSAGAAGDQPKSPLPRQPKTASRTGFRHHLREATAAEHEAVEAAFAPLTADLPRHLTGFLAGQRLALRALSAAAEGPGIAEPATRELLARLDRDLPGPGPALPAFQGAALDPLAVDYLVLGSRLGTEVLRRHLADAAPALPMPAYFRAPPATAEWRALCQHLDQINPESDRAARILFDAGRGFGIFTAAAQAVLPPQPGTETRA